MSVEQAFDHGAEIYDRARRQLIPCFDDFYGTVISLLHGVLDRQIRVLDLGAGTGLLSGLIADSFPLAQFHLTDISSKMLDVAATRASLAGRAVELTHIDLRDILKLGRRYDAIVSSLAIHHLSSVEKQNLFGDCFALLENNGIFINADQALGATAAIEEEYRREWLRVVEDAGVSDDDLQRALERMKEDKMDPLRDQLDWLRQAGFTQENCWYQNFSFCVYSGRKTEK